jgi:hypothetical protein
MAVRWRRFSQGQRATSRRYPEDFRKKVMGLSSCTDRTALASADRVESGTNDSSKAASRRRLAEALRANLGRRKAQKRDRAKQAEAAAAQDETAQSKSVQSGGISSAAPPPEDSSGLF